MGKKKWCFGRDDVICMTKDCPYMSECIQVVWEQKMSRLMGQGKRDRSGTMPKLKSTLRDIDRKAAKLAKKSKPAAKRP